MKIFLFLYPIKAYVNACLEQFFFLRNGYDPARFSQLIDRRYRRRNYQLVWVLFSHPDDSSQPDRSLLSEIFEISPQDQVIACGVSFRLHCEKEIYPNPAEIIDKLPTSVEELVVGGFHQWDCVDKLACFAYKSGIPTQVDEDTTQFFFHTSSTEGNIPF